MRRIFSPHCSRRVFNSAFSLGISKLLVGSSITMTSGSISIVRAKIATPIRVASFSPAMEKIHRYSPLPCE